MFSAHVARRETALKHSRCWSSPRLVGIEFPDPPRRWAMSQQAAAVHQRQLVHRCRFAFVYRLPSLRPSCCLILGALTGGVEAALNCNKASAWGCLPAPAICLQVDGHGRTPRPSTSPLFLTQCYCLPDSHLGRVRERRTSLSGECFELCDGPSPARRSRKRSIGRRFGLGRGELETNPASIIFHRPEFSGLERPKYGWKDDCEAFFRRDVSLVMALVCLPGSALATTEQRTDWIGAYTGLAVKRLADGLPRCFLATFGGLPADEFGGSLT